MDNTAAERGARLKALRAAKGISQSEAAAAIPVSRITYSGWENGAEIEEKWLPALVTLYGASRGWIRYGEGEAPAWLAGTHRPVRVAESDLEPRGVRKAGAKKRGAR